MDIEQRIAELKIQLPEPSVPAANYKPYIITDNYVYISGQIPLGFGDLSQYIGKVDRDFNIVQGQRIAKICGLNVVAQLKSACAGDLSMVMQCLKLTIYVNSTPEFTQQSLIANGASDLIKKVFDKAGEHARAAVGVTQLPRGVAVEVEGIFKVML